MEQGRCTAIVLAAGQGKRMHSKIQKQFLEIGGKPILYYSMECFQKSPLIQDIILVTGEDMISYCQSEIVEKYGFTKVCKVTAGGKERYDSVYAGLLCCQDTDYVYIHDGARPFVTEEMIQRGYEAVKRTNACIMGMPSKDTVKLADPSAPLVIRNCFLLAALSTSDTKLIFASLIAYAFAMFCNSFSSLSFSAV